jgi:hypothetical protein
LNDRAADVWEPLFAIADLAGGEWPKRARDAAVALHGDTLGSSQEDDADVRLFRDLHDIFGEEDFLATEVILEALIEIPEAPWAEWQKNGKPITARGLAKILKPFEITPKPDPKGQIRGYYRADFEDTWARYMDQEVQDAEDDQRDGPTGETAQSEDIPEDARGEDAQAAEDVQDSSSSEDPAPAEGPDESGSFDPSEPPDPSPESRATRFSPSLSVYLSEKASNKGQEAIFICQNPHPSDREKSTASPSKIWISDRWTDRNEKMGPNSDGDPLPQAVEDGGDAAAVAPSGDQLPLPQEAQPGPDPEGGPGPGWWLAVRSSDPDDAS